MFVTQCPKTFSIIFLWLSTLWGVGNAIKFMEKSKGQMYLYQLHFLTIPFQKYDKNIHSYNIYIYEVTRYREVYRVYVCKNIHCQNLCIQMGLLPFKEAVYGSYAVVPMMLPLLKHFQAPLLGIPFRFWLLSSSNLPVLCSSENENEWDFHNRLFIGKHFWKYLMF